MSAIIYVADLGLQVLSLCYVAFNNKPILYTALLKAERKPYNVASALDLEIYSTLIERRWAAMQTMSRRVCGLSTANASVA